MESTHEHAHAHGDESHDHPHNHANDERHDHGHDQDWNDEDVVNRWLEFNKGRTEERRRQFVTVRAVLPKLPEQEFRYLNLGAGSGDLDEVLLEHFPRAHATVLDGSMAMLSAARQSLARFGERVEYVQANLSKPAWLGAVGGPYDAIVMSKVVHHVGDTARVRELYREVYGLAGHGGVFLNLDYVRPSQHAFDDLAAWAARDPEAGLVPRSGSDMQGSLSEQLGWLGDAGFGNVDVVWKDMNLALFFAVRDHLHLPDGFHDAHSHQGEVHSHQGEAHSPNHEAESHSHDHDHGHSPEGEAHSHDGEAHGHPH